MEQLPINMLGLILSSLEPFAIGNMAQTSKLMYKNINDPLLTLIWKQRLKSLGFDENLINQFHDSFPQASLKRLFCICFYIPVKVKQAIYALWQLICLSGDPILLEAALSKGYVKQADCWDSEGRTVAHYIALSGIPSMLDKANDLRFDVNKKDNSQIATIHYAALSGKPAQLDKAIALGLEPQVKDSVNASVIHYAVLSGVPEQVDKAIQFNYSINDTDQYQNNLLHYAVMTGEDRMVKKIIDLGLNPTLANSDKLTPYDFIKENSNKFNDAILSLLRGCSANNKYTC